MTSLTSTDRAAFPRVADALPRDRLLCGLGLAALTLASVFAVAGAATGSAFNPWLTAVPLLVAGGSGSAVLLARAGRATAAAHTLVWTLAAAAAVLSAGMIPVRPAVLYAFLLPVVCAGLLRPTLLPGAAATSCAVILALGVSCELEVLGPRCSAAASDFLQFLAATGLVAMVAFALRLAGRPEDQEADSTARHAGELAALAASERSLTLALEAAGLASFDWNVVTGEVRLSARWNEMLGGERHPAVARFADLVDLVHPDDRPRLRLEIIAVLKGSQQTYGVEHRVRRHDASWLWIHSQGSVVARDAAGRAVRMTGTNADITERKRAELALRERDEQFRALFAQSAVGVTILDEGLRHLQVNDKFCEMTGYDRPTLLRMSLHDLDFPPPAGEQGQPPQLSSAGELEGEVRLRALRRHDGAQIRVSTVVTAVRDAAGHADRFIAVIQDVTEQERAEAALAAQRAFLRQVIDLDPNFIFAKDRAGRFVLANRAVAEAHGTTVEALIGRTETDAARRRDELERSRRDDLDVLENRREKNIAEEKFTDASGVVRWLQTFKRPISAAGGAPDMVLGVATDITERKRAAEVLADERNLLRAVIDNLPELVFVKDRQHRFVLANSAWIAVRAHGDANVIGRRLDAYAPPGAVAAAEEDDREVFRTGRPIAEREAEMVDSHGERRCYVVRKLPLRDASGEVVGLVGISRDVTEEKQHVEDLARFTAGLEARVRERTAQLERANRELEAFTFSVSHDLRAPLRAIDGFTERVLTESTGRLSAKSEGYLHRVRLAGQRMTRLIDNLLEMSQTGRRDLNRRAVDVSAMANEIGVELREAEPGRAVRLSVQPGLVAVADGELLRIVLDNLMRNAWKFTSGRAQASVEVGCEHREGRVVYWVRDNGAGFDMRRAGRLFAPFQRLHRAAEFPGTGIGLAVAQRVVRRHMGEIWAHSELDRGATFYFTLEAGAGAAEHGGLSRTTAGARPELRQEPAVEHEIVAAEAGQEDFPAVLVVDDDDNMLELLRDELGRDGHLILTAPDGETALRMLERGNVGVVVSDYSMPGMNGTRFLGIVRERYPAIARILYTSRPDSGVLSEAVNECGINCLVEKDWDRLFLRARVREAVIAASRRG